MRLLRALAFFVMGLVAGGAAAGAAVLTCNAVHKQDWPANGSPDWTVIPGLAVLALGPVAGGIAGLIVALRTGRGR